MTDMQIFFAIWFGVGYSGYVIHYLIDRQIRRESIKFSVVDSFIYAGLGFTLGVPAFIRLFMELPKIIRRGIK